MIAPFLTYSIERYGDCATVTVVRITDQGEGKPLHREVLSSYETLSYGAAASAKREMKKFRAATEANLRPWNEVED